MSATASSASVFVSPRAVGRRLASEPAADGSIEWRFKRNCSMTPGQCLRAYLALSALSLGIAAFFWWGGAPFVLPFAGIEVLGLGTAVLVYSRHASDRESIAFSNQAIHVEHQYGAGVVRADFDAAWLRVEPITDDRSLVELSGQGRRIAVGRYLRPELRSQLAAELRQALRAARGVRAGAAAD